MSTKKKQRTTTTSSHSSVSSSTEEDASSSSEETSSSEDEESSAASSSSAKASSRSKTPPPKTIHVGNLTINVTKEHLFEMFSEYGKVKKVDRPLNKGVEGRPDSSKEYAYIEFERGEDADRAIAHMAHGQIDGRFITCEHILQPTDKRPVVRTSDVDRNRHKILPMDSAAVRSRDSDHREARDRADRRRREADRDRRERGEHANTTSSRNHIPAERDRERTRGTRVRGTSRDRDRATHAKDDGRRERDWDSTRGHGNDDRHHDRLRSDKDRARRR